MRRVVLLIAAAVATLLICGEALAATGVAPGAPGAKSDFAPADKHGFGTSKTLGQQGVVHARGRRADRGLLSPTSARRAARSAVRRHRRSSFAEREQDSTVQRHGCCRPRSLTYRQVNTDKSHRWRITKTYVTDPAARRCSIDVRFESLTGRPYHVYVLDDPRCPTTATTTPARARTARADRHRRHDRQRADRPAGVHSEPPCGYKGTSDGWTDLQPRPRMDWHYGSAPNGNVVADRADRRSPGRAATGR